ncbi:MAG: hypothetical protein ACOC04_02615 [Halothece sp.]
MSYSIKPDAYGKVKEVKCLGNVVNSGHGLVMRDRIIKGWEATIIEECDRAGIQFPFANIDSTDTGLG